MTDETTSTSALPDFELAAASRFAAAAELVIDEISPTRVRGHIDLGPSTTPPGASCTAVSTPPPSRPPRASARQPQCTPAASPPSACTTPPTC